jgi:methionyl aminopeptidase
MIIFKTDQEIELIRESSLLVAKTLAEVAKAIEPGVKTSSLDKIAEDFILSQGARPAFKGYNGFPFTLCISVNKQVVHGMPGSYELKAGDVISVDCGVVKNGFYGDSAHTFAVGEITPETEQLLKVTYRSLMKGIEKAIVGNRVGDISSAVQTEAESNGYGVVRELVGHGVGKNLHESPEVPNYGRKGAGAMLKDGMVLAIEPMINLGKKDIIQERDGWTISTSDGKPSAHFEHTVAIRKEKADILSSFKFVEEVLKSKGIKIIAE